jgi:predicted transcriptional regulator
MTANRQSIGDRHDAIIALAQARPELSFKAIGAQFGVSGSCVSQIISGKRGKRRQARLDRLLKDNPPDAEFGAIRMIIAALEPLGELARERVTQFALSKLRDIAKEAPTYSKTRKTPRVLAGPGPISADTVGRQTG